MAYGQIDPARLEGEALRRWYLRSPAEIEEERRLSAEQKYRRFFGGPRASADAIPDPTSPARVGWVGTRDFNEGQHGSAMHGRSSSSLRTAAAPPRRAPQPTLGDCIDCHGILPPLSPLPLPPPIGTLPLPSGGFPMFRDLPGSSPSGPRDGGRKECELQDRNDRRICGRQPTPQDQAICHASASERRAYCDRPDGTIGHPALDTAKRLRGR